MNIESFSGAATVAATCTIVFFVGAKSWRLIARTLDPHPDFGDSISRESAQRYRDEHEQLSYALATYLGAGLVFVLLFAAAHSLNADRLYSAYPDWQLYVLLAALSMGALLGLRKLAFTSIHRYRVKLLRDANIAVGHQLQRKLTGTGRFFHDVETSAGIVDHLFVGESGVFAVNVFARRANRNGQVALHGNELRFEPSGHTASTVPVSKCVAALEREFRRLLDHRVRVRSVIAVPGWNISDQSTGDHLLVNEQTIAMLDENRDPSDVLGPEDVKAVQDLLVGVTAG